MKLTTDILIIGAGPSGCVAALTAEKLGFKSIVLERKSFPRDKICGDGILLKDVKNIFGRLGIDFNQFIGIENHSQPPFFKINDSKQHEFNIPIPTVIIKREEFDNTLWNAVGLTKDNLKFDDADVKSINKVGDVYIVECCISGELTVINTKYIVAADGYSSFVRRNHFKGLKFRTRVASRFYLKTDVEIDVPTSMIFDEKVSPGYFWFFRIDNLTFNTGVYLAEDNNSDIYELHRTFLKKYFDADLPKDGFKTWPIPYNVKLDNLVKDNVILTGDAAGLCDKMFGHGIDNAITSGYLAVLSIHDSNKATINYPLEEIYRYNLNMYIGDTLRKSVDAYNLLETNPDNFVNVLKQYV